MHDYPRELLTLIALFKKFPGIGTKTAERFAFQLLNWPPELLSQFATEVAHLKQKISPCPTCGCLKNDSPCAFCDLNKRDTRLFCLVSSPKDVYAIEETGAYKGLYHVISTLISPLKGHSIDTVDLEKIKKRLIEIQPAEVIIAFDSTLEGDATALYLRDLIGKWGLTTSRLAFGLPMGSSLEYVDYGTLERALKGRSSF